VAAMMQTLGANPFADRAPTATTAVMVTDQATGPSSDQPRARRTACIIGAGLTGLTAAAELQAGGWKVVVLDKGRAPGGRAATRYLSDCSQRCDVGAQFWTARDPAFAAATAVWVQAGWAEAWGQGFPLLNPSGLQIGGGGFARWRAVGGMVTLARHLAQGLDLRAPRTVTALKSVDSAWDVIHVGGDAVRGVATAPEEILRADAVIMTMPVPQILTLLAPLAFPIPPEIGAVQYDRCLYLLAEKNQGEAILPNPGGIRIEDGALGCTWIASARQRGLRDHGEGIILHADAQLSASLWDDDPAKQMAILRDRLAAVLARLDVSWTPDNAEVRRWRYGRCSQTVPELWWSPGSGLFGAGDAFGAAPRVEGAWLSGRAVAGAILRGH